MAEGKETKKLKVRVFIDGSNIYFAQKKLGKWLDWVKGFLTKEKEFVKLKKVIGTAPEGAGFLW